MRLCLAGTYRVGLGVNNNETCTTCPTGQTTSLPGATALSGCDLCAAGHGGATCGLCGGGSGVQATYGDGTLLKTACKSCPAPGTGFAYSFNGVSYPFAAEVVARSGAKGAADCLSQFAQIRPGTWWLESTGTTADSQPQSFEECASSCGNGCLFATWNYGVGNSCRKRAASNTTSST
jgi:hypothetical protein